MVIPFKAVLTREEKPHFECWPGDIFPIQLLHQPYEAIVHVRGFSYHLIFGEQSNGWFLCIPDWQIGTPLAKPTDTFWNEECLIQAGVSEIDAVCITDALKALNEYLP